MSRVNSLRRVFIVGSSRSGTTVLQRVISERLNLVTLPETDFFGIAAGGGLFRQWLVRAGWSGCRSIKALERLNQLLTTQGIKVDTTPTNRFRKVVARFLEALDSYAIAKNSPGWLEKTPKHFRHVGLIQKYVPDAHFVHLLRSGPEVVASVVQRAQSYPGRFPGQKDPHYAIRMWNRAVAVANRYAGQANHTVLLYESFCRAPESALAALGATIGLTPKHATILAPAEKSQFYTEEEVWKSGAMAPVAIQPSKFATVFTPAEQAQISRKLNLAAYERLARRISLL